jgi:hypothetical protein
MGMKGVYHWGLFPPKSSVLKSVSGIVMLGRGLMAIKENALTVNV